MQNKAKAFTIMNNNGKKTRNDQFQYEFIHFLVQSLKLLKLRDVYNLELAKFMHEIYNNKTPSLFKDKFTKLEKIHSHKT